MKKNHQKTSFLKKEKKQIETMSNLRLSSRIQVLSLYRNLQHEARNFKNYNFREYAK